MYEINYTIWEKFYTLLGRNKGEKREGAKI